MQHRLLPEYPIEIDGGGTLRVATAAACARFSLRVAPGHAATAAKSLGCALPRKIGDTVSRDGATALCLGPDEWHVLAPLKSEEEIVARFAGLYARVPHSLVDVSHRDIGLKIEGKTAAEALNAGCPLDLRAMAPGTATRTIFDKAQILLIKESDTSYRVEVARSFALHVWRLLETVAREIRLGI